MSNSMLTLRRRDVADLGDEAVNICACMSDAATFGRRRLLNQAHARSPRNKRSNRTSLKAATAVGADIVQHLFYAA